LTLVPSVLDALRSPEAVRERSENIFRAGLAGELGHFAIALDRLPRVASRVAKETHDAYPDGNIPYHGRFRHFGAGGVDRLALLEDQLGAGSSDERARACIDLVVTSVLLDAGAGPDWRYREAATGRSFERSEGLAVASFHMFASGLFSARPHEPLRADAARLAALAPSELALGFQASEENPLVGLSGRARLLEALSAAMFERPDLFGHPARAGNLLDPLREKSGEDGLGLDARELLRVVLDGLSSIWPSRTVVDGVSLGDVWRHPRAGGEGPSAGLVPFHKLSQWLCYSLLEPLELAGIPVRDLDALTGLAEYRNGGLFVDMGVLEAKHPGVASGTHRPDSELVVEWRALTVALLDRVADGVRDELGMDAERLPLAKVLEGGTWRAGRSVALELREDGGPPIRVESDGTVF
jgi:Protein of unknown function (DUF1688)